MKRPRKHLPAAHYVRCFAVTNEQPIHSLQTSWSAGQVQMGVLGTQSGLPGASKVRSELSSEQKRTAPRGGAGEWGCAWMRKQPLRRLRWECPWRLQANRTCGRSALVFSRGSGDKWAGKIEQEWKRDVMRGWNQLMWPWSGCVREGKGVPGWLPGLSSISKCWEVCDSGLWNMET